MDLELLFGVLRCGGFGALGFGARTWGLGFGGFEASDLDVGLRVTVGFTLTLWGCRVGSAIQSNRQDFVQKIPRGAPLASLAGHRCPVKNHTTSTLTPKP